MVITKMDEWRFWGKVDSTTTPDWCWPWTSTRDRKGYGQFWINGKYKQATHIALELAGYIIPARGLQVRHKVCNNPPCCRTSHLRIGTPQEDTDDKVSQGRQARVKVIGERNGNAELDPIKVSEILALYQRGVRGGRGQVALAKQFGVARSTIQNIVNGQTWRHIDPTPPDNPEAAR